MNKPSEWTEENLNFLIQNKIVEDLHYEYKAAASLERSDSQKNEISKDVSAFGNSDGGVIVYGIKESKGGVPRKFDGVDPGKKEWLEQVIHSNIRPPIDWIDVKEIPLNKVQPGKVAYVVNVPQSNTAHQAKDKKYYKRSTSHCLPMEDYEIRLVMNRVTHPLIESIFSVFRTNVNGKDRAPQKWKLNIDVANKGQVRARDWMLSFFWPANHLTPQENRVQGFTKRNLSDSAVSQYTMQRVERVIFPTERLTITDGNSRFFHFQTGPDDFEFLMSDSSLLRSIVYADDMLPREESMPFHEIKGFNF